MDKNYLKLATIDYEEYRKCKPRHEFQNQYVELSLICYIIIENIFKSLLLPDVEEESIATLNIVKLRDLVKSNNLIDMTRDTFMSIESLYNLYNKASTYNIKQCNITHADWAMYDRSMKELYATVVYI